VTYLNTDKRLDNCYKSAKKLRVNDQSKLIFFSDVHRGDNSMADEFAHNQNIYAFALDHYYNHGFTYIEVGDGDELMEHAKFSHIRSAHSDTYMMLRRFHKDNRLIYMYGNHNMNLKKPYYVQKNLNYFYDEYLDKTSDLFLNVEIYESLLLEYELTNQQILVVHGHQGDLFNDQLWFTGVIGIRLFWRYMHMIGFHNPASPSKNKNKRHKIEKNFSKWIEDNKVGILCGHTHRPKLPEAKEFPYLNSGCCIHPRGITGIEFEDGKFTLVYWHILPDSDGKLCIQKKLMRGPIGFSEYTHLKSTPPSL
jgi:UDP-2,3-diacylglucosamine pyrophosphatase LpxH